MTFYAITIEPVPGFGFEGGPEFDTLIRTQENSSRNRRTPRRYIGLHKYRCPMKNIPKPAALAIKRVFVAMLGASHTFLHLDYLDFEAEDEAFGTGDGVTTAFTLKKTYDPGGGATYERDIIRPDVDGEIIVADDDPGIPLVVKVSGTPTAVTFNSTTKKIEFAVAPALGATLTWTGRHYIQVRFNRDDLPFSIDNKSGDVFITNGTLELTEEFLD